MDEPIASSVAPGSDPWDMNVPPLLVDDKVVTGDPSFVHVAMCIGTDMNSQPIELIDRMCLNGPAVSLVFDELYLANQNLVKTEKEYEQCSSRLERSDDAIGAIRFASPLVVIVFVLIGIVLGRTFRKQ